MLRKIKNWFSKSDDDTELEVQLPKEEDAKFILTVDNIRIGMLYCDKGDWYFKYTEDFKDHSNEYNRIVGFPDLNKTYKSETLWPFFQIRIPGLKQPAIQEILENEKINKENEAALLKRFGQKSISNPYKLVMG
ncbi:HipA N-terminal domain-containing protein [Hydrobacter penzbergensis]|uniref:HipA N-terminal domain-containing protein n=1 Tax=Hydrobacter penzbergensis TaxID=1235997 RepID=A0A8X8IC73_9BACT|nr:HipA N-terminal domain-containing protein [Hydrobacter penzbergensis]SDW84945.1 HipA N-terminal domain-containing protein [Hydrobacter penzbergensis]